MREERDLLENEKGFEGFRLLEHYDIDIDMDNLKGDCYSPKVNTNIDPETLKEQEKDFEKEVYREGVFGYTLERWNPETGIGWETVDSCWGFVGRYSLENDHYIVEELSAQAKKLVKEGN